MKSYFLGIVVAIALSAVYVTYNTAEVTVSYLGFHASFNQGIWDVFLFGAGAIIMWILSLCASIETYSANKKRVRELNKKIEGLEDEKKSLLSALQSVGKSKGAKKAIAAAEAAVQTNIAVPSHEAADDIYIPAQTAPGETAKKDDADEEAAPGEERPSAIKSFFASIFKGNTKPEPEEASPINAETGEKDETEEREHDPAGDVCEPGPEGDITPESENDSPEKQDREFFSV